MHVRLLPLTNAQWIQIPAYKEFMSPFRITNAATTFVAVVTLDETIDFYKTAAVFERSTGGLRTTMSHGVNRVAPSMAHVPTLANVICDALHDTAQISTGNYSYQFFRILVVFESIFDKPQQCCCRCIQLCRLSNIIVDVLEQRIAPSNFGTRVSVPLHIEDVEEHHGPVFVAMIR